jgi:hypothetical protein
MKRHVWGVLAATLVAPYLVGLMMGLFVEFDDMVNHGESFDVLELLDFLFISTGVLIIAGVPLLIVASFWIALLDLCKCRTKLGPILAGIITGVCSVTVLVSGRPITGEFWVLALATSSLSGAICGWIYWRIAIRQTPDSACPITTP